MGGSAVSRRGRERQRVGRILGGATVLVVSRTRYRYGQHRWQRADLWLPPLPGPKLPVVVLIHGGYWRGIYSKVIMNRLARAVVSEGWAAWNIDYRRLGRFGGGGGWPATFSDVGDAVDHLEVLDGLDLDRVVAVGHSAGGHLGFWAGARRRAPKGTPGTPPKVQFKGVISLAGLVDLDHALACGLGLEVIPRLLGGSPAEVPERYAAASPAALLPLGIRQVLVHGLEDTLVPAAMSSDYTGLATECGDDAVFEPVPGLNHRQLIDPRLAAWPVVVRHLRELFA
jgi:acetyl esterase/lipase